MLIANSYMEEGINWQVKCHDADINRSISNVLFLRGLESDQTDVSLFTESTLYSPLFHSPLTHTRSDSHSDSNLLLLTHPHRLLHYDRFATLLSNDRASTRCIDDTVTRAWKMYGQRAYIHQYTNHGLQDDTFMDCFATIEQVLSKYKNL